jgi:hypothetical protein
MDKHTATRCRKRWTGAGRHALDLESAACLIMVHSSPINHRPVSVTLPVSQSRTAVSTQRDTHFPSFLLVSFLCLFLKNLKETIENISMHTDRDLYRTTLLCSPKQGIHLPFFFCGRNSIRSLEGLIPIRLTLLCFQRCTSLDCPCCCTPSEFISVSPQQLV